MHDPMVVAHEIPSLIPRRQKYLEKHYEGRRWGWTRRRRTNAENLGQPVYPFWRPAGWTFALGGRVYALRGAATVWHVEPGGRDSGEVCKHYIRETGPQPAAWLVRWSPLLQFHPSTDPEQAAAGRGYIVNRAWKWHVHHWHIQIPVLQGIRSRLFDRCELCGRKGRPNQGYMNGDRAVGWRKWRSRGGSYHSECMSLIHTRQTVEKDETLIRHLFAAYRLTLDLSEPEALARLTDPRARGLEFPESYRLTGLLGYKRDGNHELVSTKEQTK